MSHSNEQKPVSVKKNAERPKVDTEKLRESVKKKNGIIKENKIVKK